MNFDPVNDIKRRPPYVEFYDEAVVDPVETQKRGYQCMKSVDYVLVRPLGSKDDFRQEVSAWLKNIEELAKHGQFERGWVKIYREMYAEYKAEGKTPVNGMPIEQWAQVNKGQALTLKAAGCHSVEDLAEWPDGELPRLGMGSRALKESALAWLKSSEKGRAAAEITRLAVENENKDTMIAKLEARLAKLESRLYDDEDESEEPPKKKKSYYKPRGKKDTVVQE